MSKETCPFCKVEVSASYFGEHLFRHHQPDLFLNHYGGRNLDRLLKCKDKPYLLKLGTESKLQSYFCCLDCLHITKRQPFIGRHFPTCAIKHNKKVDELYSLYKDGGSPEQQTSVEVKPTVVEGCPWDYYYATIGALMRHNNNLKIESLDYQRKYEYLEEKIKDLPEDTQEEIEESLPDDYPDDDDVELDNPEDVTQLYNLCSKLGIPLNNDTIKEAYEKLSKTPLKKKKTV